MRALQSREEKITTSTKQVFIVTITGKNTFSVTIHYGRSESKRGRAKKNNFQIGQTYQKQTIESSFFVIHEMENETRKVDSEG